MTYAAVRAQHHQLAVRHVDDAHHAEGDGKADGGEHRAPIPELRPKNSVSRPEYSERRRSIFLIAAPAALRTSRSGSA